MPVSDATASIILSIPRVTFSRMSSDVDSLFASSRGAVCLPVTIMPTESSLSFKLRLCLPPLIHLGVHSTESVTKSTPSTPPRIAEDSICTSLFVTALEHSQVPVNSSATITGISATAIEGLMLGSLLGYEDGIIDGSLDGRLVGKLVGLNEGSRLGFDEGSKLGPTDGSEEGAPKGDHDG